MTTGTGTATLAVVVVNHDAGEVLGTFLSSLGFSSLGASLPEAASSDTGSGAGPPVSEVIVVDNASSDGSSDNLVADRRLRVVRTGANLGYGAGVNRGTAETEAEFVLVSNPDVAIHPGALETLLGALTADPALAIAGPAIFGSDGQLYPSARQFPSLVVAAGHALLGLLVPGNRFSRQYRMDDLQARVTVGDSMGGPVGDPVSDPVAGPVGPAGSVAVDWVSGACFMARHEALKELGGFDESYFMYVEDLDLCWRAHRAGWGVAYVPGAAVTHVQGFSTARRPYRMLLAHHRSTFHFASRRAEGWRRVTLPGVALVLGVRFTVACARQALGSRHKNSVPGD